jgi:5-hydroxyisourate hydrolase
VLVFIKAEIEGRDGSHQKIVYTFNLALIGVHQHERIMMGLSTHVLDTAHGCPAAGMSVKLFAGDLLLQDFILNADGRNPDGMLISHADLKVGTYRLSFDVAGYFKARGVTLPEPNFLTTVSIDFGIAKADEHYHVPLLVSPWSYSTYRGS